MSGAAPLLGNRLRFRDPRSLPSFNCAETVCALVSPLMRVFFFGGKDQARLNYSILRKQGHTVPFVFDSDPRVAPGWDCVTFSDAEKIESYARQCDGFLVCIGNETRGRLRVQISLRFLGMGLQSVSAVHPETFFGDDVICGRGLQTYPRSSVH